MNEEYLWDRSGEPDAETVRLENLLGGLKHSGQFQPRAKAPRRTVSPWWLAAAAALIAAVAVPLLWRGPATNWQLPDGQRVRAGQTLESGSANLKIHADDTGAVSIDPGSRLRLVQSSLEQQRFDLQHGTIHAFIWARPGKFVVDTASSKTTDLGCMYTLQMSESGDGLVTVEVGWVAFERNHMESFIPAGAACVTRPNSGPGTPYFTNAQPAFTAALAAFDTGAGVGALDSALALSTPHDALSLWHLIVRTHGDERARVYDRLSEYIKLPPEAGRAAVMKGDRAAIDAAWNALDLGNTDWWRTWKRQW